MAPPAQVIGQVGMVAGEGQTPQPEGGGAGLQPPALHPPGPPLHRFRDRLTRLQGQAAPAAAVDFLLAPGALAAAGQAEGGAGRAEILRPEVGLLQPGAQVVLVEAEGVQGRLAWLASGVRPPARCPPRAAGPAGSRPPGRARRRCRPTARWRAAGSWPLGPLRPGVASHREHRQQPRTLTTDIASARMSGATPSGTLPDGAPRAVS